MEPEAHTLMAECIDKNMCDKDEYPQTAEIEADASISSPIFGILRPAKTPSAVPPPAPAKLRCSVVSRRNGAGEPGRGAQGKSTDKPNLVCGPVQVCWHKFGRYFDVEVREVPVEGDRF